MERSICLVHFNKTPGGIELLLPGIIRAFSQRVFHIFVIRPSKGPSVYENMGCDITFGSKSNMKAMLRLFRFARQHRRSVFHMFNVGPIFLLTIRLAGVSRVVYSIRGTVYWHNWFERVVLKSIWRMAIDSGRHIFTSNSEYSGKVFNQKILSTINCILLYNYCDSGRFKINSVSEDQEGIRKIIYVGRLTEGKGLEKWIRVALEIHRDFPAISFEIYGSGRLEDMLKLQIEESGASEYISIPGHRKDVENVYRDADLLLFLSERESFGNVAVESILCGTPVLVSDIPSMREIFRDYPEFILRKDISVTDQIRVSLQKIKDLKDRTIEVRRQFEQRFSMDSHIKTLADIYGRFDDQNSHHSDSLLS